MNIFILLLPTPRTAASWFLITVGWYFSLSLFLNGQTYYNFNSFLHWDYYKQAKVESSESFHWTYTLTLQTFFRLVFALLFLGQIHGLKELLKWVSPALLLEDLCRI